MRLPCVLLVVATACARPVAPLALDASTPVPAAPAMSVDDCTLATPLVPGVPGSPGHLLPSDINPNGASELAALMRLMQNELTQARGVILDGGVPPLMYPRFRKMRCAWPTAAADRNEQFDGLALAYLATVRNLDARTGKTADAFDNVLTLCHACHNSSCPGPLVVIDALRITPLDAGVQLDAGVGVGQR